jgi:cell division protein FtsQ
MQMVRTGRLPAMLLGVGLAVLLYAIVTSDEFRVTTVTIRGNSLAYADSVVAASGALDHPIFQLDTETVAQRAAGHPAVESAEVSAVLPNRVIVDVVERTPVLVWQTGDRAVVADTFGWVLAETDDPDLPRVYQSGGNLPAVGTRLAPEMVVAVLSLQDSFGRDSTIEFVPARGFSIHLPDARVIIIGDADRIPLKLAVIDAVRERETAWVRLDVRDPDRPSYQ